MSIFSVLANEGYWGLSELILHHLSDQDLGNMRLTCQHFKIYVDSQKFWHERILVAILKKTNETEETEIIQKLLATKDINKMKELTGFYQRMDYKMHSPLWQLAAQEGHLDIVEFCWNWSDSKDLQDNVGWTPLHWAAENGHIDVVRFLFERIKDKNPQDNAGWTLWSTLEHFGAP